jgi:hypothetical protein
MPTFRDQIVSRLHRLRESRQE